jgi:general secretion pathway protein I
MRNDGGFLLLEVLVAFIIAALALAVVYRETAEAVFGASTAGRYEEATARARSHLAALGRDVAIAPGEYDGDDGGGYRWDLRIARVAAAQPPVAAPLGLTAARISLYAVRVTVSWKGTDERRRQVTLMSERLGPAAPATP